MHNILRIDGPYLKKLADLLVSELEKQIPLDNGKDMSWTPALLYLQAHPDDKALYEKTVSLARKHAKVSAIGPKVSPNQAHRRLYFSWNILLGLGIIREGMEVKEMEAILGEPTYRGAKTIVWRYCSRMHVNPSLAVTINGGKIQEISMSNRYDWEHRPRKGM